LRLHIDMAMCVSFQPLPHKVTFTQVTCTYRRIVTFIVAIVAVLLAAVAIYFIGKYV